MAPLQATASPSQAEWYRVAEDSEFYTPADGSTSNGRPGHAVLRKTSADIIPAIGTIALTNHAIDQKKSA